MLDAMPAGPVLRRATLDDAGALATIFAEAARAAWEHIAGAEALAALGDDPAPWRERLAAQVPPAATWVAELADEVVGFAMIRPGPEAGEGELDLLYTRPSAWGAGAGRALLTRAESELRAAGFAEATLWTEERNHRPLRVYAAAGWRPDGAARERTWRGAPLRELRLRRRLRPSTP
jgi:GNAT superfamily N-acetyltransferase